METRTHRSILSILSLALLSTTGCVGTEYFDVASLEAELEMALEDLEDGFMSFEDSASFHAISADDVDLGRDTPTGSLENMIARQINVQVRDMIGHDPCDATGIVIGRYRADEDDSGQGQFQGALTRSSGDSVLEFYGDWQDTAAGDGTGTLEGVFETNDGEEGVVEGMFFPRLDSPSGPMGTFQSRLDIPETAGDESDDHCLQVLRGVWHTMADGSGVLVGYRAKCTMPDVIDPAE